MARPRSLRRSRQVRNGRVELLEQRRLLCSLPHPDPGVDEAPQYVGAAGEGGPEVDTGGIIWSNRGTTDNFGVTFGSQANNVRQVVDAAFYFWNQVISNLNQTGGNSQIDVSVTSMARGTGQGGGGGVDTLLGNKPRTGSITIGGGSERNGTPGIQDGEGYYIDLTPYDYSEFQGDIVNATTGEATPGSAAANDGNDLFSLVAIEIQHALGIDDRYTNLLWRQDPNDYLRPAGTSHATAQNDTADTPGKLYYLNAPGVQALFTSNNGGSGGEDRGYAVHSARPSQSYTTGGVTYTGQTDTGTTGYPAGRRYLPSYVAVQTFSVMYGYTVNPPQDVSQTFYAVPDRANRQVLVRNTHATSSDLMQIRSGSGFFFIDIDIGSDVPGTNLNGLFVCQFNKLAFDTVIADGGGGTDFIRLESNDGSQVTLRGGAGDDFIDFSFGARNLNNINANARVEGGSGFDQVFVYDNNQVTARTFTLTLARFDRPGWGGFSYASDTENHTVTTGIAADTVNIPSTFANQPIVVASAGGGDSVNIGNAANGVRGIEADVQIQNNPSFTTLTINNGADTVARNATINQFGGGFGVLSGLAPANIFWDNADIQNITVITGSADDTLNVLRCSERLFLRNTNGVDRYNLGNSTSGMSEVTAAIDVGPNTAFVFNDIYINDTGISTGRNYTWTRSGNGFVLNGLPAPLYYEATFTLDIQAGGGNDNFTLTAVDDNFINCHGNGGFDTFTLDDRAMPFAFVESTMLANVFSRNTGGIFATVVDTVYDGMESVTFFAHGASTSTVVTGVPASIPAGQQATIVLGNNVDAVNLYPHDASGNLTINGNLGINGGGGSDQLRTFNNSSTGGTYSMSNPFGTGTQNLFGVGLGGLGTASIENWQLNGGSGDDTWNINQFTSGVGLAINGGDGQDAVNYGNNGLGQVTSMASFNFNGQDGYDTFFLNNQTHTGTWTYTRNLGSITASSTLGASYFLTETNNELMRINGGPSAETFNINSSTQGGIILDAAGGADVARLGVAANNVEAIQGAVNFQAGGDGGRVEVLDTADTTGDTFHLSQQFLGGTVGDNLFGPGGFLSFNGLTDIGPNPALLINCGSGSDTAFAQPLASGTTTINFGAQNFSEGVVGDQLNLALAAAENYVITGTTSGNVTSDTTGRLNWTSVELPVAVDDVAPSVVAADFVFDAPAMALTHTFNEEISPAVFLGNLTLTNLSTNEPVPYANMSVNYDVATSTISITFPGYVNGVLPDGNYRLELAPGYAVDLFGNGSSGPFDFDTFVFAGDADRDRSIDISDFATLAANFNSGTTYSQGDFDYSGLTDIGDFAILAAKFNTTLPAAAQRTTASTTPQFSTRPIDPADFDEWAMNQDLAV